MTAPSVLIDTHILLWLLSDSKRLKEISWLDDGSRWTISPISLLEMKFLQEVGKLDIDLSEIIKRLRQDERFVIDDIHLEDLCLAALDLSWTRDPFDRLLVAHSLVRALPFGTQDQLIRKNFSRVI